MLSFFSGFSLLTKSTTPILGSISSVFGVIMNGIYNFFFDNLGVMSLGLTIIVFTIIVRILMLPLAVRQQKSTREMQVIQPELKKLQERYKNKKDPESQKKYQAEMQALYQEHGVNPFGGCLPLLVQMPIIFSLFAVLRSVPAYIVKVKDVFTGIYTQVASVDGHIDILNGLNHADLSNLESAAAVQKFDPALSDKVIDLMATFSPEDWDIFKNAFSSISANIEGLVTKVNEMNYFMTINLAERPISGFSDIFTVGALIPLLCLIAQVLVTRTMNSNKKASGDSAQDQTQKTMMMMMPLITVFFVSTMPAGLGLYWLTSNVFQLFQQIIINKHLENESVKKANAKISSKSSAKKTNKK